MPDLPESSQESHIPSTLPDPPIDPAADLRGFPFMQLDVARLRDSDFAAEASAEGFRAGVLLWCACWHQQPAASLPNKPRVLARLAGVDLSEWEAISDEALHGFIACSDGRLYHPLIADKAADAWERKQESEEKRETERERKAEARRRKSGGSPAEVRRKSGGQPADAPDSRPADVRSRRERGRERRTGTERESGRAREAPSLPVPTDPDGQPLPDGLIARIHEAFASKGPALQLRGDQFHHIRELAVRAAHEPDPHDWTRRYLNTAWRLREAGRDVWRGQPWRPSAVCSEKMMARVIEAMGEQEFEMTPEWEAVLARIAGRKR